MAKYIWIFSSDFPNPGILCRGGFKGPLRLVRFLPLRWPRRLWALAGAEGRADAAVLPAGVQLLQHHAETGQDQGGETCGLSGHVFDGYMVIKILDNYIM